HQVRSLSEAAQPGDPDIGRTFAPDLVTQPQPELQIGDTRPYVPLRVVLAVGIQLDQGLQNDSLCEEQLVFCPEAGGGAARIPHVGGCLDVEEVRRETLNAESEPVARGPLGEVMAHAGLRAPPAAEDPV